MDDFFSHVKHGHVDDVEEILLKQTISLADRQTAITMAIEGGQRRVLTRLFDGQTFTDRQFYDMMVTGLDSRLDPLQVYYTNSLDDPSPRYNAVLLLAIYHHQPRIVELILSYGGLTFDNRALVLACQHDDVQTVELLLEDERFDPTIDNNDALRTASEHRRSEVVHLLIRDPRVILSLYQQPDLEWIPDNLEWIPDRLKQIDDCLYPINVRRMLTGSRYEQNKIIRLLHSSRSLTN